MPRDFHRHGLVEADEGRIVGRIQRIISRACDQEERRHLEGEAYIILIPIIKGSEYIDSNQIMEKENAKNEHLPSES